MSKATKQEATPKSSDAEVVELGLNVLGREAAIEIGAMIADSKAGYLKAVAGLWTVANNPDFWVGWTESTTVSDRIKKLGDANSDLRLNAADVNACQALAHLDSVDPNLFESLNIGSPDQVVRFFGGKATAMAMTKEMTDRAIADDSAKSVKQNPHGIFKLITQKQAKAVDAEVKRLVTSGTVRQTPKTAAAKRQKVAQEPVKPKDPKPKMPRLTSDEVKNLWKQAQKIESAWALTLPDTLTHLAANSGDDREELAKIVMGLQMMSKDINEITVAMQAELVAQGDDDGDDS